ncbi:extracellular solute-binding protein [Paenibacillus sp. TRM 82003]|nr:extracellular solute-binding protein [Paenibacillus sp. TRM 82003]
MKRKPWYVLGIVFTLMLTACNNDNANNEIAATPAPSAGSETVEPAKETPPAETEPAAESPLDAAIQSVLIDKKEVSISFWTGTGAANFPVLEEMVNAFQAEHPNIKVDFSNQGPIGELTGKLTQNIVSKSTPTLSNMNAATFPQYIESGAIVDLLPYYEHETIGLDRPDGVFPYYLEETKSYGPDGTMYGFPTNKKTADVLVYNKTYFDGKGWAPPKTWDEVAAYAKTIYEETGKPGFSFDNAYGDGPFMLLSKQWGSPYILADGTVDIGNDASAEALKFYKQHMESGYFTMPALLPSAGGKYSSNGFVMEETYMFVGAAAGVQFAVPKPESGHKAFEVGVAPVPQKDPNRPVYFSKGEDYAVFTNSTEEERVAAWLLIAYLTDPKPNVKWLTMTGNLPISQAMVDEPEYKQFLEIASKDDPGYYKSAAVNAVLSAGDLTFTQATPRSAEIAEAIGTMWESIMIGGGDVDQLLQETAAGLK